MHEKQEDNIPLLAVGRAIDELRRQSGVVIRDESGYAVCNYPIEFLDEKTLQALHSPGLRVLITAARARTLGLEDRNLKIEADGLALEQIVTLADPLMQASLPPLTYTPASEIDMMALKLAKLASLLPALLLVQENATPVTARWLELKAADLRRYLELPHADLIETAQATLPVEGAEHARIACFRSRHTASVHLALIFGEPNNVPLTRIHSSCVTGDILGSLRCDCGNQLKLALDQLKDGGILIYLHQEGRGIGITNKLRAYKLQEQGVDTYDANLMLGFEEDERDFSIAGAILKKLGVSSIRMLTNNPQKMAAVEKVGIKVTERVPLATPSGRHNHAYLDAKAKKSGHIF